MADMYLGNESGGFDLVGTTNIKNINFEEAKISKEDYENLSEEEKKSGVYLVTGLDDTEDSGGRADLISYDNTNSGLGSTNVQGAIDELNSNLESFQNGVDSIVSTCKTYGSTPSANTPIAINTAIKNIYNAGVNNTSSKVIIDRTASNNIYSGTVPKTLTINFTKSFSIAPSALEITACNAHGYGDITGKWCTISNITKTSFEVTINAWSQGSFTYSIAWVAAGIGT